jgi:arylsulfatase A-like enzyme
VEVRVRLLFVLFAACDDKTPSGDDSDPTDLPDSDTGTSPETPPGGNLLLLVADDLGVDKIAAYGISAEPVDTPNIDTLIATGLRFENAWSLPECGPTRAAMMTGRHARRTGNGANESIVASKNELGPEQVTFVEVAKASPWFDYDAALVGKWHLSTFDSQSGVQGPILQGFDSFSGTLGNLGIWVFEPEPVDAGYFHWEKVEADGTVVPTLTYATTDVVDDAVAQLGVLQEPWILEVAFHAAHGPYDVPPDELLSEPAPGALTVREKERLIVEAMDKELGRVLAAIPDDVRSRTTILFLGDNGTPQLAVEPEIDPDRSKMSVYEPGVHVPFVVQGPLVAEPGSSSAALVHVVDVLPTVADIVGFDLTELPGVLDPTQPLALDGESLLPILADPSVPTARTFLYTEMFYPAGPGPYTEDMQAVRDDRFKLIRDAVKGEEQFFEYPIGGVDEGLDLLPCGLDAEQQAAYDRLRADLENLHASMVFDAIWTGEERPPEIPSVLLDDISCAGPP